MAPQYNNEFEYVGESASLRSDVEILNRVIRQIKGEYRITGTERQEGKHPFRVLELSPVDGSIDSIAWAEIPSETRMDVHFTSPQEISFSLNSRLYNIKFSAQSE